LAFNSRFQAVAPKNGGTNLKSIQH